MSYTRWTVDEINKLRLLIDKKTNDELAEIYGISNSGIRGVLIKYHLKRKLPANTKEFKFEYKYIRDYLEKPCKLCISHHRVNGRYILIHVGNGKRRHLHAVIYEQVYGRIKDNELIRHRCDNPSCCELTHLEKGTTQDNMNDKVKRDRQTKGEQVNTAKLSEVEVKKIKIAIIGNTPSIVLAKRFNISPVSISDIKRGKTWKHIETMAE